jgi:hypothetical protein
MDAQFFRKYVDIINEAQTSDRLVMTESMLTEGIVSSIAQKAKGLVSKLAPAQLQQIQNLVSNAIGKPIDQISMSDLTMGNIQKVIAANKQTVAEADQNAAIGWGGHDEYADIPGSKKAHQQVGATAGGVLGTIIGLTGAAASSLAALPAVALAAGFAIAFAAIGVWNAGADRTTTGRYDAGDGKLGFDPARRNPVLDTTPR